jgi:hypothetical protein
MTRINVATTENSVRSVIFEEPPVDLHLLSLTSCNYKVDKVWVWYSKNYKALKIN